MTVSKLDAFPVTLSMRMEAPTKVRPGEDLTFKVYAMAEDRGELMEAAVKPAVPTYGAFSIICDEGTALGGQDSAPSPLGYFTAGVALCLMSHLRVIVEKSKVHVKSMRVEYCQSFATSLTAMAGRLGDADMWGKSTGIEFHVHIESEEPRDRIEELHKQALSACMATQALVQPVPMQANLYVNGKVAD